jgi:hypothetical protein
LLAFRGPIPTDRIAGDWQALAAIIVHSRDYKEQQQQCALLLFVCLLYYNTRQQLNLDWRLIEREEGEGMKLMMRNGRPLSSWHIFLTSFVCVAQGFYLLIR